jgi:hypothetical protein
MQVRARLCVFVMGIALALGVTVLPGKAQAQSGNSQHVVGLDELTQAAAQPAQSRQADESAVRQLFSSGEAQEALKSAKIDYKKVDKAIAQLSDDDLAKLAAKSRQAQSDFAAGSLSRPGWIAIIVLVAILIIVLAIVV